MRMNIFAGLLLFVLISTASCSGSSSDCVNCDTKTGVSKQPGTEKTIILDVRTTDEWNNDGHAACTVNYPLDELESKIDTLKTFEKVQVVCRSGHRAAMAKEILEKAGLKNVENMGAWQNISCK